MRYKKIAISKLCNIQTCFTLKLVYVPTRVPSVPPLMQRGWARVHLCPMASSPISQLPNLLIGILRIRNCILLLMRSFSKMLPSVKFAEDKVLVFVILREKC